MYFFKINLRIEYRKINLKNKNDISLLNKQKIFSFKQKKAKQVQRPAGKDIQETYASFAKRDTASPPPIAQNASATAFSGEYLRQETSYFSHSFCSRNGLFSVGNKAKE
jgi:hypothetical protein